MPIAMGRKNGGGTWFNIGSPGQTHTGQNPVHALTRGPLAEGYKGVHGKSWVRNKAHDPRPSHGNGPRNKAASAMIAKIPLVLSRHIAVSWKPERVA